MTNDQHSAFLDFYERYQSLVYGRALSLTRHKQTAEDLTQDCFLRVWRVWPPQDTNGLHRWLYTIVNNLVRDLHRATQVRPVTQEINEAVIASHMIYEPCETIVEAWARLDTYHALTTQQQHYLLLTAQGYSAQEIAQREGVEVQRVYDVAKIARKAIKRQRNEVSA